MFDFDWKSYTLHSHGQCFSLLFFGTGHLWYFISLDKTNGNFYGLLKTSPALHQNLKRPHDPFPPEGTYSLLCPCFLLFLSTSLSLPNEVLIPSSDFLVSELLLFPPETSFLGHWWPRRARHPLLTEPILLFSLEFPVLVPCGPHPVLFLLSLPPRPPTPVPGLPVTPHSHPPTGHLCGLLCPLLLSLRQHPLPAPHTNHAPDGPLPPASLYPTQVPEPDSAHRIEGKHPMLWSVTVGKSPFPSFEEYWQIKVAVTVNIWSRPP